MRRYIFIWILNSLDVRKTNVIKCSDSKIESVRIRKKRKIDKKKNIERAANDFVSMRDVWRNHLTDGEKCRNCLENVAATNLRWKIPNQILIMHGIVWMA